MTDVQPSGVAPEASDAAAAEPAADSGSHPEGTPTMIATVQHPVTGETHTFHVPAGHTDPKIRYELPDGTIGEWDNPNGIAAVDPDTDDVIWDPSSGSWVARVRASEAGGAADVAAV